VYKYTRNLVPVFLLVYATYLEGTVWSETSEHKIQTLEDHAKERIKL
jgi:hypothetical protein